LLGGLVIEGPVRWQVAALVAVIFAKVAGDTLEEGFGSTHAFGSLIEGQGSQRGQCEAGGV
jgi:hypothetical protein